MDFDLPLVGASSRVRVLEGRGHPRRDQAEWKNVRVPTHPSLRARFGIPGETPARDTQTSPATVFSVLEQVRARLREMRAFLINTTPFTLTSCVTGSRPLTPSRVGIALIWELGCTSVTETLP